MGIGLLAIAALVNAAAFFGLRHLAARASGVRGVLVILGIEHRPWISVSFARKGLFAVAGPVGCYLAAVGFITCGLLMAGSHVVDEESMRVRVMPSGPAAASGFQDNDEIVSVNDVPIRDWAQLKDQIAKHPGEQTRVVVQRNGGELTLTPTPGSAGKIGVGPPVERRNVGFGSALASGVIEPMRVWVAAMKVWMHIFFGREQPELVGPVGIVKVTNEASGDGVGTAFKVVGLLNAYLLWIPSILAFVFFPRGSRAKGNPCTEATKPTLS